MQYTFNTTHMSQRVVEFQRSCILSNSMESCAQPSVPAPTPQSQNKMTSCYPESLQDSTHGLNPNQATQAAHIFNDTHTFYRPKWMITIIIWKSCFQEKPKMSYPKLWFSQEFIKIPTSSPHHPTPPKLPGRLRSCRGIPFMIVTSESGQSRCLLKIHMTTLPISTLHGTWCAASSTHTRLWTNNEIHCREISKGQQRPDWNVSNDGFNQVMASTITVP